MAERHTTGAQLEQEGKNEVPSDEKTGFDTELVFPDEPGNDEWDGCELYAEGT